VQPVNLKLPSIIANKKGFFRAALQHNRRAVRILGAGANQILTFGLQNKLAVMLQATRLQRRSYGRQTYPRPFYMCAQQRKKPDGPSPA
jgi:hypothetical protein